VIGATISHYRIQRKIGSGGMGEIYLAEDTKLERNVALKFLPRHLTEDGEARTRFEREAKAAAALSHPNIVTVYEIGDHEGQVFIAMEYVEGKTLKELISASFPPPDGDLHDRPPSAPSSGTLRILDRLPIPDVLDIAAQILDGLAAAHARGIVHRDIKPQNILIDGEGRVKILDFGLAKLQGASRLTQGAFAMGTVHYMSPEQGQGRDVDQRTDIWSFGIVLYEMLSGKLPFHGDLDQAVIFAILNEDTPPLGIGTIPECAGLESIIRRCLAKKRQDRFPSAAALASALRELGGAKGTTRPEQGPRRKLSRRALLSAILLLLLSGSLGFVALNPKARAALGRALGAGGIPRDRHLAMLPLKAGSDANTRALADGFSAVIVDQLTWLEKFHDSIWTVPADIVFRERGRPAPELQRLLGCNLFISGDLQSEANSLRLRLKLQDALSGSELNHVSIQGNMANLSLFQDGLLAAIRRLLALPEKPGATGYAQTGGTSMPGAYILFLKGKGSIQDSKNPDSVDLGISRLEKALQQDGRYVLAHMALAQALRAKSMLSQDPLWRQKAMEQASAAMETVGSWPPAQMARAVLLKDCGRKAEALAAFSEVLRLDPRCYAACIELAGAFSDAGRVSESENLYKRAVGLRPGYPPALGHLAYFYNLNGRFDEALACYKRMTVLAPDNFNGFNNMGGMYLKNGERANAIAMFEKSNAIQPNATAQSNLATLYFFAGEYRKALPMFSAALRTSSEYWLWGNLADTYRQLPDQSHLARPAYEKAIALAEALLKTTPDNGEILSCLAMYHAHCGEKGKALAEIAQARSLAPFNLEIIRRAILVHEAVQERSQALAALREYRERLGGLEEIEAEPDLAGLRRDPAYLEMAGTTDRKGL
jgi:serine/threonine-protein kinase